MSLSPRAQLLIEAAKLRTISRANPLLADLPPKFTEWYPRQKDAIQEIVNAFDETDLVILEGPPGSGKTVIGETVRRIVNPKARTNYICSTKDLQRQVLGDFGYAKTIMGRANYPTQKYPGRFHPEASGSAYWSSLSCADCNKGKSAESCSWCADTSLCPYELSKREAVRAGLAVANTAYFLTEANSRSKLSLRGARLVIADEADTLDDQLLKWASVQVGKARVEKYGLGLPKRTVEDDWRKWVKEARPKVDEQRRQLGYGSTDDVKRIRERQYLDGLAEKLEMLELELAEEEARWVYTGGDWGVEFKPVWADRLANSALWRHGGKWLLMSATIGSADEMVRTLGWEKDYRFVSLPSTFPAENRLVVVRPTANMSHKANKENKDGWDRISEAVRRILADNPDQRILIHTVSYALTAHIYQHLLSRPQPDRPVFTHTTSQGRRLALDSYLEDATGRACLLSPSMDRGIDLPGDRCRVQVIVKVPFPNLGDRQVAGRAYGSGKRGKAWYNMQTVRTMVQMCGRAVRGTEDWAKTYVLDEGFVRFYAEFGHLFPGGRQGWWAKGLRWER